MNFLAQTIVQVRLRLGSVLAIPRARTRRTKFPSDCLLKHVFGLAGALFGHEHAGSDLRIHTEGARPWVR